MSNLTVKIGNLELNNPVILASGTCGPQLKNFTNLSKLGSYWFKSLFKKDQYALIYIV